jgi:hypothetical protein
MTETITGVFETPSTAKAAVDNLKMARIPTAVVRFGGIGSTIREDSDAIWQSNASRWQMPLVLVAVHEKHADAVTSIMRQYGPVRIEERMAQSQRR